MNISTMIFDAYGTLIDTSDGSVCATRDILRKRGSVLEPTEVYARWKSYHKKIIATSPVFRLEESLFVEGLMRVYEEYGISGDPCEDVRLMMATLGVRKVFDDALPCVQWCRERFQVVVASNTDTVPFQRDLHRSGLAVDAWFTSESLRAYKPHREFYDRLLERLGRLPQEVVFVGDSIDADVVGPKTCGMSAIWLNRTHAGRPDVDGFIEITDLTQLPDVLTSLQGNAE